jgi:hypothetical protein
VGANPIHQGYQAGAILVGYGGEFQAQASAGNVMLHDGFGTDLSLGDEKIKPGSCAQRTRNGRRKEQSAHAQITNPRNIFGPHTSPADPQSLRGFHPRNEPSGIKRPQPSRYHTSPPSLRNCARGRGPARHEAIVDHNETVATMQSSQYPKRATGNYLIADRMAPPRACDPGDSGQQWTR